MAEAAPDLPTADEAFDHAPTGMAMLALDTRFLRVNRALCELLGYRAEELLERRAADVVDPEGRPGPSVRERALADGRAIVDRRFVTASGARIWATVAVSLLRSPDGAPRALIAQLHDVSERKRLEEDLRHAADHDALTGLRNRRRFELDLATQVERCRRYDETAAVVLLDLDDLKRVNDTHGHQAGDRLIQRAARVIEARLRASDTLARLGGDEFAAILPHVRPSAAVDIADSLVRAIAVEAGHGCTASAGVTVLESDCPAVPVVIGAADRALYAAKRGGRNRAERA